MKKILLTSVFLLVLLSSAVTSTNAQVSIIINPPGYGYVNSGYVFYPGPPRGCGGGYNNYGYHYNNGWHNGNRGYGYNNGCGRDWDRGRRGGYHHGGCR